MPKDITLDEARQKVREAEQSILEIANGLQSSTGLTIGKIEIYQTSFNSYAGERTSLILKVSVSVDKL